MLESNRTSRPDEGYHWDIFIAYAAADKRMAEKLYGYLHSRALVFLASQILELGDDWDTELAAAQRGSLITTVLISSKTAAAYYQREEIAAAIALSRDRNRRHRVIPIYLDRDGESAIGVPYGLRLKHGISISRETSLQMAAERLLDLLSRFPKDMRPSRANGVRTIDIRKLARTLTLTVVECVKTVGNEGFKDAQSFTLAEPEMGLGNEVFPVIRSLIQKGQSDGTLSNLLERLVRDLAITDDDQALLEEGLANILQQDDPLAWQIELLLPKLDELRAQLSTKRIEWETALQKAESHLLDTLYSEALACVESVPDELSLGARKKLIKAIALIERRSFNNLDNVELENIERHLISASKRSKTSSLPFVLLAVLEIDYYRNHGRCGRSGITPPALQEALSNHPLSVKELSLLKLIRISERASKALKLSTLSPE